MKKMKIFYIFQIIVSAISLVLYSLTYPYLPNELPAHWSTAGVVNGSISKASFYGFPISLLMMGIACFTLENSNAKKGKLTPKSTKVLVIMAILILLMVTMGLTIYYAVLYL